MTGRPWIEATALLAAHGLVGTAAPTPYLRRYPMTDGVRFAFITRLDAVTKPRVFPSIDALADHIEGMRFGQAIQVEEVEDLRFQWRSAAGRPEPVEPDARPDIGVQIWTLMLDNSRDRALGFAWLDGGSIDRLQPALERARRRRAEKKTQPLNQAA